MKPALTRIAWFVCLIAAVAINVAIYTALSGLAGRNFRDLALGAVCSALAVGALPMVNILAIGLLIAARRPESRPFVLGFELLGCTALLMYLISAFSFTRELLMPYMGIGVNAATLIVGPLGNLTTYKVFVATCVVITIQVLPQLLIAVAGGFAYKAVRRSFVSHS